VLQLERQNTSLTRELERHKSQAGRISEEVNARTRAEGGARTLAEGGARTRAEGGAHASTRMHTHREARTRSQHSGARMPWGPLLMGSSLNEALERKCNNNQKKTVKAVQVGACNTHYVFPIITNLRQQLRLRLFHSLHQSRIICVRLFVVPLPDDITWSLSQSQERWLLSHRRPLTSSQHHATLCCQRQCVEQNARVYSLDHSPGSRHERRDAPRGAGLDSVSRLRKDRYHPLHQP